MASWWWSWLLTIVGLTGFYFVGLKKWWSWYINIGCQFLWLAYALISEQYGFIIASVVYFLVFSKNAYEWTMDHRDPYRNFDMNDVAICNSKFDRELFLNQMTAARDHPPSGDEWALWSQSLTDQKLSKQTPESLEPSAEVVTCYWRKPHTYDPAESDPAVCGWQTWHRFTPRVERPPTTPTKDEG